MLGFHRNKPVEIGLVAATKRLLDMPPSLEMEPIKYQGIGCTRFLKKHTSTRDWECFQSMAERAIDLDHQIFEHSLQVTLCMAVKDGWFEKRSEGKGRPTFYRRIAEVNRKKRRIKSTDY